MPKLKADIRVGETLRFQGEGVTLITLMAKSGQRARLQVSADDSIEISHPQEKKPKSAPIGLGEFVG